MTPNLFLATQKVLSPHKWFKKSGAERPTRKTERWDSPVPGLYEYIPGRGWYLIATDKDVSTDAPEDSTAIGGPVLPAESTTPHETVKMTPPVPVRYSKVLKRYMLAPDYEMRKKYGHIQDDRGKPIMMGFFQLDDGIAWVQCWDGNGEFIPGPYKLWCVDAKNGKFRHMLKGDDPNYINSRANSSTNSRINSRANSFEREAGARRRSQDSRSTHFRSGPGSTTDGPSVTSTRVNSPANSRANSIRNLALSSPSNPTSPLGSQANSRLSSPKRNPGIPFEEAKARLRIMADEQAAAASRARENNGERGRRPAAAATPID